MCICQALQSRQGVFALPHLPLLMENCTDLERLTPYVRELSRKQYVTAQSLEKIEDAAYAIAVRGSEYDLPQERLDDIVALSVSNFSRRHRRTSKSGNGDGDAH